MFLVALPLPLSWLPADPWFYFCGSGRLVEVGISIQGTTHSHDVKRSRCWFSAAINWSCDSGFERDIPSLHGEAVGWVCVPLVTGGGLSFRTC